MKIGIYPGSFDPISSGHIDVIQKAVQLCDKVYVVVAINEDKNHMFSLEQRSKLVSEAISKLEIPEGKSIEVIQFGGIISNLAKTLEATIMIRGIRDHVDLSYELNIEQFTKYTAPEMLTVYFTAEAENVYISSSLIRQFIKTGNVSKIEKMVPAGIYYQLLKYSEEKSKSSLVDTVDYIQIGTFR